MFSMNLEPQGAGSEEFATEIIQFIAQLRVLVRKFQKNAVEIAEQFLEDMKNIGEVANLANMDETPSYFDIRRSSTIDKKGYRQLKLKPQVRSVFVSLQP